MVIGVVSIVTITAVLQGVKREVRSQLEGLGANVVIVVPGQLNSSGQPNPMAMMGISTLTAADAAALKRVPGVVTASPVIFVAGSASRTRGSAHAAFVVATSSGGMRMNPSPIVAGRYFTAGETDAKVCVLADRPRRDLFGAAPAVGRRVWVRGQAFRVVGVLKRPDDEGLLGSHLLGLGDLVYLPLGITHHLFPGGEVNRIVLKTDYLHPADGMIDAMDAALRASHHGVNDFGVITQKRGLALVIRLLNMVQALL
ncbi:MAG: ABC transporter permease, partial [Armatimonadetes bacterium]|nr:ABC transporter permease [Armatimonadota bacterium]